MNSENAGSVSGSAMLCVHNRRLARIASERNVSVTRVAGCVDAHERFVYSPTHVDGTTRTRSVCGMLNAPRRSLGAGIRIIPGRRHIQGGVGQAKCGRNAQHKRDWKFHGYHPEKGHPTRL